MRYASAYEYVFTMPTTNGQASRDATYPEHGREVADSISEALRWFIAGSEHASAGQFGEAEEAFSRALLRNPHLLLARYQLGFLQLTQNRIAQALLTWTPLRIEPQPTKESQTLIHFVDGFLALANEQTQTAIQEFEAGVGIGFDNEPLLENVRKVLSALKRAPVSGASDGRVLDRHVNDNGDSQGSNTDTTRADVHLLLSNYAQTR